MYETAYLNTFWTIVVRLDNKYDTIFMIPSLWFSFSCCVTNHMSVTNYMWVKSGCWCLMKWSWYLNAWWWWQQLMIVVMIIILMNDNDEDQEEGGWGGGELSKEVL